MIAKPKRLESAVSNKSTMSIAVRAAAQLPSAIELPLACHGSGPTDCRHCHHPVGVAVWQWGGTGSKQESNQYSGRRTLIARTPFLIVRGEPEDVNRINRHYGIYRD